jgi:hypothetical protein
VKSNVVDLSQGENSLPIATALPLRQGPPRPSAYRSPPRSPSLNSLDSDVGSDLTNVDEDEGDVTGDYDEDAHVVPRTRSSSSVPLGEREFAALFASDNNKTTRDDGEGYEGEEEDDGAGRGLLDQMNEVPRYSHAEVQPPAGVAQVIAIPLPFGAPPPSSSSGSPAPTPSDKMMPPPPTKPKQQNNKAGAKRPPGVSKVPVHREVANEAPLVFGDTPIRPPPPSAQQQQQQQPNHAGGDSDGAAATFIAERHDLPATMSGKDRKRFPWGPRSMDFEDFRSTDTHHDKATDRGTVYLLIIERLNYDTNKN